MNKYRARGHSPPSIEEQIQAMQKVSAEYHHRIELQKQHKRMSDDLLLYLGNLDAMLQYGQVVEDPQIIAQLREIVKLGLATSMRLEDADEIEKELKVESDRHQNEKAVADIGFVIRRYRLWLHNQEDLVRVDRDVVAAAENLLIQLDTNVSVRKAGVEEPYDDGTKTEGDSSHLEAVEHPADKQPHVGKSSNDSTKDIVVSTEAADEQYESWEAIQHDTHRAEAFVASRHRRVECIIEALEAVMSRATTCTAYVCDVALQMDKIIEIAEGGTEDPSELISLESDIAIEPQNLEEYALHGLKDYRVFLHRYPGLASEVDTRLLAALFEAREEIARLGIEVEEVAHGFVSCASSEAGEVGSDGESMSLDEESSSDTEMYEEDTSTCDCSCGAVCRLALARPLTPEGELSEEERNMEEEYEKEQEMLKEQVDGILWGLSSCTKWGKGSKSEDPDAGANVEPHILIWAKKVIDLAKGTKRADEKKERFTEDEIDSALDVFMPETCSRRFMYHLIRHYLQASDEECQYELDERVIEACKNLLEAVSEATSENQDEEGPS